MIHFILIEENETIKKRIKEIIDKVLMNFDIDYKIIDEKKTPLKNILELEEHKIYIIEKKQGLEVGNTIRYEQDDWQSILIFIGDNLESLIKERLFALDYISIDDDFNRILERDIKIALKNYDRRPNKLKYTYKKTIYNIDYYKILYIEKEQNQKKCMIKTKDNQYPIQETLSNLENQLDNRFIKCNKSYIINIEQVDYYDTKENLIKLKNQEIIYSISKKEKNKIIERLRNY